MKKNILKIVHTLYFFNIYSKYRKYWFILIISIFVLISIALFIQYFFLIKPCILCIYQRCALCGIAIAGIIALTAPNILFFRLMGSFIWLYSALQGLLLSKQHITIMFQPSPFVTCDLFIKFPNWLPLHKWCPTIFDAMDGSCTLYKWYFLSFELSQWMFFIFINYLILALLTTTSQFIHFNNKI